MENEVRDGGEDVRDFEVLEVERLKKGDKCRGWWCMASIPLTK